MNWNIKYFSVNVENQILDLPDGLLARYLKLTDMMLEHGSILGLPHTKSLSSGLFELRLKSKEGIARVFYCTKVGKNIIMLHSFVKKSQKLRVRKLRVRTRLTTFRNYKAIKMVIKMVTVATLKIRVRTRLTTFKNKG